ncbi:hypothetical protein [Thiohalophilus sp.]|uniref:hypothetical protein n=1 Tax=Thiohalophilus sp. TaxID=3028392 RepID=UPI002ACE2F98|nr:hypothetical protein [Thiohalophilus sp.]MDZ7804044.1 hypothetical protein [Thiohalophilus sp.]
MKQLLIELKPLRIVLILCALLTVILQPEPGASPVYHGWGVVPTLLIPVLAPLLFMLLMLDSLMTTMLRSQSTGEEHARYGRVRNTVLVAGILVLLAWLPYFIALMS